jgi:hypothetical protein
MILLVRTKDCLGMNPLQQCILPFAVPLGRLRRPLRGAAKTSNKQTSFHLRLAIVGAEIYLAPQAKSMRSA